MLNSQTHTPITFPPPEATGKDRVSFWFINRQVRQLLDDSLGDGSLITGSEARTVDTSGSQLIYILYLAPGAPQIWKLLFFFFMFFTLAYCAFFKKAISNYLTLGGNRTVAPFAPRDRNQMA